MRWIEYLYLTSEYPWLKSIAFYLNCANANKDVSLIDWFEEHVEAVRFAPIESLSLDASDVRSVIIDRPEAALQKRGKLITHILLSHLPGERIAQAYTLLLQPDEHFQETIAEACRRIKRERQATSSPLYLDVVIRNTVYADGHIREIFEVFWFRPSRLM